jgi:hypothetical protein
MHQRTSELGYACAGRLDNDISTPGRNEGYGLRDTISYSGAVDEVGV